VQREGCEDKVRKPALNVSHTKLEEAERDQGEPGQMETPNITEEKPMTEVCMFNSPIASRSMRMVISRNVLTCFEKPWCHVITAKPGGLCALNHKSENQIL
jgi:hypothetical protein